MDTGNTPVAGASADGAGLGSDGAGAAPLLSPLSAEPRRLARTPARPPSRADPDPPAAAAPAPDIGSPAAGGRAARDRSVDVDAGGNAPADPAPPGAAAAVSAGPDNDLDSPPGTQPPGTQAPERARPGRPRTRPPAAPAVALRAVATRPARGRPPAQPAAGPPSAAAPAWGRLRNPDDDEWMLADDGRDYEDAAPAAAAPAAPVPAVAAAPVAQAAQTAAFFAALGAALRPPAAAPAPPALPAGPTAPPPPVPLGLNGPPDFLAALAAAFASAAAAPPIHSARPAAPSPASAAPHVGLFRAAHEAATTGMDGERAPTAAELRAVTREGLLLIFDVRRIAEITRPRDASEDTRAAAAIKAQETLSRLGHSHQAQDTDAFSIYYGFQVVFRPNQSPMSLGKYLQWSVPFSVHTASDISTTPEWAVLYAEAKHLLDRLLIEIPACRSLDREFNMPASLFASIRTLAETYFRVRAQTLWPLLRDLGTSPTEEHARTIIRAYIAQARDLPLVWAQLETTLQTGGFLDNGVNAAVTENAARTALALPFLRAMVNGQARSWSTTDMVAAHIAQGPPAPPPAGPPPPPTTAPPPPPPPPAVTASTPARTRTALSQADALLGFRLGPQGARTHPAFFSGEYATPPGWLPPPSSASPPAHPAGGSAPARAPKGSGLCIPVARSIVASSSPFTTTSPHACEYCHRAGHAQYECPRRFNDTYGRALPGFTAGGDYAPAAWYQGDMTLAARAALASYLGEHGVHPHRRFAVTLEHISCGTAPPAPAS